MNARSRRRAQEREVRQSACLPEPTLQPASPSTGPRTEAGKAKASLNALKTGLTGRTVLLPSDDLAAYEAHLAAVAAEYTPVGPREATFVQSLADNLWRTARIGRLEMSLFALGYEQFHPLFADRDAAVRDGLIEAHTFLTYEKQLRNLNIQESRLRRQREKDLADLRALQEERKATHLAPLDSPEFEFPNGDASALEPPPVHARPPFGYDEDQPATIHGAISQTNLWTHPVAHRSPASPSASL